MPDASCGSAAAERRRKRCGGEGKIERLLLRGRGLGPRRRPPGPAAAPALLDLDLGLGRGSRFFSFSFPLLLLLFRALFGLSRAPPAAPPGPLVLAALLAVVVASPFLAVVVAAPLSFSDDDERRSSRASAPRRRPGTTSSPPTPRALAGPSSSSIPSAGGGKAVGLFEGLLAPMLEAAGVAVAGVVLTERRGDAARAAAGADPSFVGALVAVGGDGTAAELLQGLMTREKGDSAEAARRMPLAILPAGSGNALALSSCCPRASTSSDFPTSSPSPPPFPPYPASSVCATRAAAAIARGRSAPLDVVVADSSWEGGDEEVEGGKRRAVVAEVCPRRRRPPPFLFLRPLSSSSPSPSLIARRFAFLSLTYGLIANADVGTDPWRWMGTLRFTLGALREVAARRSHRLDAFVVDSSRSSSSLVSFSVGSLPLPGGAADPASRLPPGLGAAAAAARRRPRSKSEGRGDKEEQPLVAPPRRRRRRALRLLQPPATRRLDAPGPGGAQGLRHDALGAHGGGVPRLAALRLLSEVESGSHVSTSRPTSNPSPGERESEKLVVIDRVRALLLRPLDGSKHGRMALDGEELPLGRPVALEVVPGGARLIVTEF